MTEIALIPESTLSGFELNIFQDGCVSHDDPCEILEIKERALVVCDALAALDKRDRLIVRLRFWHDKKFWEIAECIGVSVTRAQQLCYGALRKLLREIGRREYFETKQKVVFTPPYRIPKDAQRRETPLSLELFQRTLLSELVAAGIETVEQLRSLSYEEVVWLVGVAGARDIALHYQTAGAPLRFTVNLVAK